MQRFFNLFRRNDIRGKYMQIIIPTFMAVLIGIDVTIYTIIKNNNRESSHKMAIQTMKIQADNVEKTIARVTELRGEYFSPSKQELKIIKDHIIQADSLKVMRMIADMNENDGNKQF